MNGHPDTSIDHHNGHHHTSTRWDTTETAEAVAVAWARWRLKTGASRALKVIFSCLFFFFDSTNEHLDGYTPFQHKASNNYTPPFSTTCPDLKLANSVTDGIIQPFMWPLVLRLWIQSILMMILGGLMGWVYRLCPIDRSHHLLFTFFIKLSVSKSGPSEDSCFEPCQPSTVF